MAEVGELALELHALPRQREGRDLAGLEPPVAGLVLVRGVEYRVRAVPVRGGQARRPQALRFGPHHAVAAVALELAAMAGVDQRIVRPGPGAHDDALLGHGWACVHVLAITRTKRPGKAAALPMLKDCRLKGSGPVTLIPALRGEHTRVDRPSRASRPVRAQGARPRPPSSRRTSSGGPAHLQRVGL